MKRVRLSHWLLLLMLTLAGEAATAIPGDLLYVTGTRVNVRADAGTHADVLGKLLRAESVVEISRQGDWVEVGIRRLCLVAWVHAELLADSPPR